MSGLPPAHMASAPNPGQQPPPQQQQHPQQHPQLPQHPHPQAQQNAQQQQPAQPRRRPPPKKSGGPLRAPRRPLNNITRPRVSLSEMNDSKQHAPAPVSDNTQTPESLRNEYIQRGASAFPLVVSRRDLKELRYHVMRLQNKSHVDIQNPRHFATPIRLHRRDPRAPPSGAGSHFDEEETKEDIEETKERERIEQQREERRKVREENQAKIAPTGTKKPQAFQKKTEQKYRPDDTPEAKKRQLLRYEETLPWHLEDFENRQTWAGTYESEMSETHVMLTANPQGAISLAPIERWYRFNPKAKARPTGDLDEKDKGVKKEKEPDFLRRLEVKAEQRENLAQQMRNRHGLSTRVGGGADDEGRIRRNRGDEGYVKREADADDIDFNLEEDFADDEEGLNGLFEGDELDVKEASEKLKRDHMNAGMWDRDEEKIHAEEEREKAEAEVAKELERGLRKTLVKRGKLIDFADSDMSDESETDSETERQRAKEEEEKKTAEQKAQENGTAPSGTSTKGSNTPLGSSTPSTSKPVADKLKVKKRPNSEMSEASGNESSRKKKKKNKLSSITQASPTASASTSRAGSPVPSSPAPPRMPSAREIYDSLPPQGMGIQPLIALFKGRVDKSNTQLFIRLVKAVSSFDKVKSWLTPLPSMPSEEHIAAAMNASKSKPKA